jgi:hypothetical protein
MIAHRCRAPLPDAAPRRVVRRLDTAVNADTTASSTVKIPVVAPIPKANVRKRHDGEGRRTPQRAQRQSQFALKVAEAFGAVTDLHGVLVDLLCEGSVGFIITEATRDLALGVRARHAVRDELPDALFDVEAELVTQVCIDARARCGERECAQGPSTGVMAAPSAASIIATASV